MQSTFSPSSLNCFDNCPKQYHFRYVEKLKVESESIEAFVGKRVHEVLERLYQFVLEGFTLPSLEKVVARYHAFFEQHYDPERVRIVREDTDLQFYRQNGVRCLENYYRAFYPFDGDTTLAVEKPIHFQLDEAGRYKVRGIIDRLVRSKDGVLEIHDFKTGRSVPGQAKLDKDRQLGLYELGIRQSEGESGPVRLVWHYLLPGRQMTSQRSEGQRAALHEETTRTIDRIRNETEWRPVESALCRWCEYRPHCPLFKTAP